ncbi:complex III assembly factor LYRM7 [Rhizophagus clarus]|uniref:Mitochondrial zinc maintenance protein 1, mitochondrial n=1 Tax=Rhizophagus clarus TaxID=94130 RepID=A0A8H3M5C4_9GLOM|nr:complex III assembly factor LYRM7 [Rhizophagus clarus]
MTINTRYAVFRAYKQLLRIQKETFKGDKFAIREARRETYKKFLNNKDEIDTNKIQKYINQANEVASILQKNIAQVLIEKEPSEYRFIFIDNNIRIHHKHKLPEDTPTHQSRCER